MNRNLTFLAACLPTIAILATIGFAAPPLGHLKQQDWFADRGLDDPGVANESAAYLQVDNQTNNNFFYGQLSIYRERNGMHHRDETIKVCGPWTARKDKRRSAVLYEYDENCNEEGERVAAITYWYDRNEEGGKQLRIALRLWPTSANARDKDSDPCDEPPDDDILEEEEPIPDETVPPNEEFDEYGDPYDPGP